MSVENLLDKYRKVSSFALWDGESAVLRFNGDVNPDFTKVDGQGVERHYLGVGVHLIKHSNENYSHQEGCDTIFRVGKTSTLNDWIEDGGLKATDTKLVFEVDMSKALGYGLKIHTREVK